MKKRLRLLWKWFLARFRLDRDAVCEMSHNRGPHEDYHDYPDDEYGEPWHTVEMRCKRCQKPFYI
jgi:hypothetical protein